MKQAKDGDILEESLVELAGPKPIIFSNPMAYHHSLYLTGAIVEAQQYVNWFHLLRHCGEDDVITLHINSEGGDAFTSIQLIRAMADCKGTLIASVEGRCMSAATLIFLTADQFVLSDHSVFMFHNYSGASFGKGGEMFDSITHERAWSRRLMETCYRDFLTQEEINAMMDGKDFWMDADQVVERLTKRAEIRGQEIVNPNAEDPVD